MMKFNAAKFAWVKIVKLRLSKINYLTDDMNEHHTISLNQVRLIQHFYRTSIFSLFLFILL